MGIGNKLVFDSNYNVEDFTFILSTRDYRHLGAISNIMPESVVYEAKLNSANNITFEVYKSYQKKDKVIEEKLWDEIDNFKLVYVKELNEYFEMGISLEDSVENIKKKVTATSLCEAELSQVKIHGLEINTEEDIGRDDYAITTFYNADNHNASLLHRVLSYVPNYTLKHVDASLINMQRSFSVDGVAVYDWLVGDCAKQFKCIFMFDSTTRGIYVYDLNTVCKDCGHRADILDFANDYNNDLVCPECGSKNIKYFGQDTTIYVDKENLTDNISFTTDTASVKNCLKLIAGDDLMTATVRFLNANGSDNIVRISKEQKKDMPDELVEKLDSYDDLYNSLMDGYDEIVNDIYESIEKINYYTHTMMPTIEHAEITATTEAKKLTASNLSPLGLSSVTESTSISTVESALKNYAKVYVKTGFVKLEVNNSTYKFMGVDNNGNNYGVWTGNFKVTNNSDKEDVAYSNTIRVIVYDDYQSFIEQKIMKSISSGNKDDDGSVFDVLSITSLSRFKDALTYYCLNRLTSFYDAIQAALDTLIEINQATVGAEFYESLYTPYYEKLKACQYELDKRQSTINEWQDIYDTALSRQREIQTRLNMKNYLGDDLYKKFCNYKREDTYQNNNYISDGLTDPEVIKRAREFIKVANEELLRASTYKHSISTTLHNLLIMEEFKPIIEMFELGNWLRIRVDGDIYRLRLIGYTLSFSSIQTLDVEFSDVTKVNGFSSDIKDILDSAKNMSTNISYIASQASKGNDAKQLISDWVKNGLDSSLMMIKNNNNQEVTMDEYGIFCKKYDDISDSYSPEQLRITHNLLVYTDDAFASCKTALGKHKYIYFDENGNIQNAVGYGLTSEFVISGHICSSEYIGGDIYSENYTETTGTHINLKDGTFSFGGGALTFDGETVKISSPDIPDSLSQLENDTDFQNTLGVTKITKDTVTSNYIKTLNLEVGKEIIMGENAFISWNKVRGKPNDLAYTSDIPDSLSQLENDTGYQTASQVTTITKNTISTMYIVADEVDASNITGSTIYGKKLSGGSIDIGDGTFTVSSSGVINATAGKIGGMNIYESSYSGSNYLETDKINGYTAGIGNNGTWALWAGYNGSTANFWVEQSGRVHTREWIMGADGYTWCIWTVRNNSNRYGLNYIHGDWDDVNKKMNIIFTFFDHNTGKTGYCKLKPDATYDGLWISN